MRKTKAIKNVEALLNEDLIQTTDEKPLKELFNQLLKDLDIQANVDIMDILYFQPFKLEYIEFKNGIKDYILWAQQKEEKKDKYSKLVIQQDKKLVSLKAFGKVGDIDDKLIAKIVLLIRLSQYMRKQRELYSLNISIKQLLE